jgi:hypothetical protein
LTLALDQWEETFDEIENVIEKTSSNEMIQVMAMLMELADSTKLPPHATVKQKTMPKVQLPMVLPIRCQRDI